jgi:hypothetical protein
MDQLETSLRQLLFLTPHWQQLELQAFWYGLVSWCITCFEDKIPLDQDEQTIEDLLTCGDEEFRSWPTEWLEPFKDEFLALRLSETQTLEWFGKLEILFQESVPVDLNIFSVFISGESLNETQWERMYETLAFQNPPTLPVPMQPALQQGPTKNIFVVPQANRRRNNKTRHIHGRRAITPIRGRKALTRRHKHIQPISILKLSTQ